MRDLDLEALREVVQALDLDPLFLVVAGEHLTGFPAPDAPVVVVGCHRSALAAALGPRGRTPRLRVELLDRGMDLEVSSESPTRIHRRLLDLDVVLLEALGSELLIRGEAEFAALRAAARPLPSPLLLGHYLEEGEAARRGLAAAETPRVVDVLRIFRPLLSGLHLVETGELVPDLARLVRLRGLRWLERSVADPVRPVWSGDPGRLGFLLEEADSLFDRLARARDASGAPHRLADPGRLDAWLATRQWEGSA